MPRIPGTNDVIGLPPAPWPVGYSTPYTGSLLDDGTGTYRGAGWAKPGSTYVWTLGMLVNRLLQLATDGIVRSKSELDAAVRAVLDVLAPSEDVEAVELAAESDALPVLLLPGYTEVPGMTYSYVSAQVHGTLGDYEEVSHTLNLVHTGASAAPDTLDSAALTLIGQNVVDAWTAFVTDPNVNPNLTHSLVYDSVTVAAKTVTGGRPKTGSAKGIVKNDGDSAHVAFGHNAARGNTSDCMPLQVAMVLSLGTQKRGGSYRGRLYLGGLGYAVMDQQAPGMFVAATATAIGTAFGTKVVQALAATDWHLNVWSQRLAAGREVASVSVGAVPDTMRSRRRSLKENRALAWGTL